VHEPCHADTPSTHDPRQRPDLVQTCRTHTYFSPLFIPPGRSPFSFSPFNYCAQGVPQVPETTHTILLVQPDADKYSRTYYDFNALPDALAGEFFFFELVFFFNPLFDSPALTSESILLRWVVSYLFNLAKRLDYSLLHALLLSLLSPTTFLFII
jgi:hypothetical protein